MHALDDVLNFIPDIYAARDAIGVSRSKYSDALMLALIHIESNGNPDARRPGSGFCGLLQIGRSYAIDACDWLGIDPIAPEDLLGDGRTSIDLTLAYFERYRARHDYHDTRIAAMHKGGAGASRRLARKMQRREHASTREAIEAVEREAGVPSLTKYVYDRFIPAFQVYGAWLANNEVGDFLVCPEAQNDE